MPAIKLYKPEETNDQSIGTLRKAFRLQLPHLTIAGSTASLYRQAINHWERFSENPVVPEIDQSVCDRFRANLLQNVSNAQANKVFAHLEAILGRCGPRTRRNKVGLAWFKGSIPWFDRVPAPETRKHRVSNKTIEAIVEASAWADWPYYRGQIQSCWRWGPTFTPVPVHDWWRAILAIYWTYGIRTKDVWRIETNAIDFEANTFAFTAKKTGKLQELPIAPWIKDLILPIVEADPNRKLLFGGGKKQFYREFRSILARARCNLELRHLRQNAATLWELVEPGSAKWLLGHALRKNQGVTIDHYIAVRTVAIETLRRALSKLERYVPSCFKVSRSNERQRLIEFED